MGAVKLSETGYFTYKSMEVGSHPKNSPGGPMSVPWVTRAKKFSPNGAETKRADCLLAGRCK